MGYLYFFDGLTMIALFLLFSFVCITPARCRATTRYAIEGTSITLPCTLPRNYNVLIWKFRKTGTRNDNVAAQVHVGDMPSIFTPFNSPFARSTVEGGNFIINAIDHSEEGKYWCEATSRNFPKVKSRKYPVHVYVTPDEPEISLLTNRTMTEYTSTPVARCGSEGGKPASKLTWMNGTEPMFGTETVIKVNPVEDYASDSYRDLVITSPTRYDHNRTFSCVIEHPAYEEPKILNHTVLVNHPPYNIKIWANVASKMVYCEAGGYPKPTYYWKLSGFSTIVPGQSFFLPGVSCLPREQVIGCTADNGFPSILTKYITLWDLGFFDGI